MKKRNIPAVEFMLTLMYTHKRTPHTKKLFLKVDTNMWGIIRINQLRALPKTMKYLKIKFCLHDSYVFWITELAFVRQVKEQISAQSK